jgi:hypothetical protein
MFCWDTISNLALMITRNHGHVLQLLNFQHVGLSVISFPFVCGYMPSWRNLQLNLSFEYLYGKMYLNCPSNSKCSSFYFNNSFVVLSLYSIPSYYVKNLAERQIYEDVMIAINWLLDTCHPEIK